MDFNIASAVSTRNEVEILVSEIDILLDSLYRTGEQNYDQILRSQIRFNTATLFNQLSGSREDIKRSLEEIKQKLLTVEYFRIVLAFEPTSKFMYQLAAKIRELFSPNAVLEIDYQSDLLGGAQMTWRGKYIDLSLRKQLQELTP
jgi:hypothetical protein